jgi:hypothetical protein
MSAAITGTLLSTVTLNTISAQLFSDSFCVDPSGSNGFWIGKSGFARAGAVYKCPTNNWATGNVTQVYGDGFMGTGSLACWISADGLKIYSIEAAGSSRILSANADGSSGSATVEWTATQFMSGAPASIYADSIGTYIASGTQRFVPRLNLATDTIENALSMVWFSSGVGPCRFQANSLIVGHTNPGYVAVWDRNTGHLRCLAGSGVDSTISAGNAFTTAIDRIHWPSSDEDGRVYFISNTRLWSLISGTIAQVGSATGLTQMQHVFSLNRIIAGSGYDWRLYS